MHKFTCTKITHSDVARIGEKCAQKFPARFLEARGSEEKVPSRDYGYRYFK